MRPARRYLGVVVLATCAALLAGCTNRENRVLFDGNYYPSKARGDRDDRRSFTVTTRRAGRGEEGARQAAVHEATRYCLSSFGTSAIDWKQVREGQEGPAFARSGDRLSVSGRCVIWR